MRSGRPSARGRLDARAHLRSGSITRAMGRRESDSSPISSVVKACPASMPENMRMVEPELPQSSGARAARARATPSISTASSCRCRMATPSGRVQPSVLAQSAPVEKLLQPRRPFGERAQHGVAVRDGLVARQAHRPGHVLRGMDNDVV